MPNEFPYDVFLSHSAKDKPVVRPLAERLRADGLRVGFDEWEIPVAASRQSAAFSPDQQGTREPESGGALPRRRYAEKIEAGQEHSQFTFQPSAFAQRPHQRLPGAIPFHQLAPGGLRAGKRG